MCRAEEQLEATGVHVQFEGVRALDDVDLLLRRGEILGLIGPNGAGKTTLVNVLSGFQRPLEGIVALGSIRINGWPPHRVASAGLARTFQGVRAFGDLTVFENVEAAALAAGSGRRVARELTWELLLRFGLAGRASAAASVLSHGDERRLGIARALALEPRFLLLDEPGSGLNEAETDELVSALARLRDDFNVGLLVIEHDMRFVMSICERIHVLDYGKTIAVGTPDEVRSDPVVLSAYLGRSVGVDVAEG